MDTPTADPYVVIEEQSPGYIRYRNTLTNERWEMYGTCDRRGDCLIGSIIDGETVRDHDHLAEMVRVRGKERIDSELDVPITPGFKDCCPFVGRWLE
jgi:hypothetical protein